MTGIKHLPLYLGSLSAIVFALAAPTATAQELHGHIVCRGVGAFTPEQLGDREGHALSIGESSCQISEGPVAGAVQTETNMWEWDGPKAKELSAYGVARKPGATFAFQHIDGTLEVTMTDERLDSLRAWHRNYGDRKLGVPERQEVRVDRQGHRSECL
jgi:hypothetical protein